MDCVTTVNESCMSNISITDNTQQFNDFIVYCRQGKFRNAESVLQTLATSVDHSTTGSSLHKRVATALLMKSILSSPKRSPRTRKQNIVTTSSRLDAKSISKTNVAQQAKRVIDDLSDKGNAIAQNYKGLCLLSKQYTPKAYNDAMGLFKLSADQGYMRAMCNLGNCYILGKGVFIAHQTPSSYTYTIILKESKASVSDQKEAVRYYTLAANQGHSESQLHLGECYDIGKGVTIDKKEALRWFHMSADMNNPYAQFHLADRYRLEKNATAAFSMYKSSAENGIAAAQFRLARCYHKGEGVEKSPKDAKKWYKMAANQGHSVSKYILEQSNDMDKYMCCAVM